MHHLIGLSFRLYASILLFLLLPLGFCFFFRFPFRPRFWRFLVHRPRQHSSDNHLQHYASIREPSATIRILPVQFKCSSIASPNKIETKRNKCYKTKKEKRRRGSNCWNDKNCEINAGYGSRDLFPITLNNKDAYRGDSAAWLLWVDKEGGSYLTVWRIAL